MGGRRCAGDAAIDLRIVDLPGQEGEGYRILVRFSASLSPDQSMVLPSSRAGVPVLSRPSDRPCRRKVSDSPIDGLHRRGRPDGPVADMDQSLQKGSRGQTTERTESIVRPLTRCQQSPVLHQEVDDITLDNRKSLDISNFRLHGLAIEFAVGLGAGPAHGGAFAAVQHAKLDATTIGDTPIKPSSASTSRTR